LHYGRQYSGDRVSAGPALTGGTDGRVVGLGDDMGGSLSGNETRYPDASDWSRARFHGEKVAVVGAGAIGLMQPERSVALLQELPAGTPTSMLADRLAGRALEHDALTGAVLRAATRHLIQAPQVEALHALLEGANAAGART
jgi:hypothetical protein